jgi:hypothetical protein
MPRNFNNEVEETRRCLSTAMQATLPSKQFSATIMLALVQLSLTKERIRKTTNLQERGGLIREFDKCRNAIQKGIRLLGNGKGSLRRRRGDMPELRQHLQDRVA